MCAWVKRTAIKVRWLFIVTTATASIGGIAATPSIPELTSPYCQTPPVIDGVLDDDCWQNAARVNDFNVLGEFGEPHVPDQMTDRHKAWITHDNAWLYVAFEVAHSHPEFIKPKAVRRNDLVQREDCVKVVFDPGTDGALWYHIRLGAGNVLADQRTTRDGGADKLGWNIPIRSATRIGETGWSAELALPFSELIADAETARARLNLIVYTLEPVLDEHAVVVDETMSRYGWAPTGGSWWSEPEKFGHLHGLAGVDFKAPFLPMLTAAEIGPYVMENGNYRYEVNVRLGAFSSRPGVVRLTVTDQPEGGEPAEFYNDVKLAGDARETVMVPVPVTSLVKRTAVLTMRDPASGEELQTLLLDDTAALDLFDAYLDRSYYTTEPAATAICRIGLPPEGLQGLRLEALTADDEILISARPTHSVARLAIPLDTLSAGRQTLTIALKDAAGNLMSSQAVELIKRPPKPGCEVKIDREHRIILRNGEPYFPYGFVMSGISSRGEDVFRALGEAGFNSIIQWRRIESGAAGDEIPAYLDAAARHGLTVATWPDFYPGRRSRQLPAKEVAHLLSGDLLEAYRAMESVPKDIRLYPQFKTLSREMASEMFLMAIERNLPHYLEIVRLSKNHPNLLAALIFDEPFFQGLDQWIAGRRLYRAYNDEDGYHPYFTNYSSHIPEGGEAQDWVDILCVDPYWRPGGIGVGRNSINWVSQITRETRRRADNFRQVTWIMPMVEYWSGVHRRMILPAEQRCQTYLMLIHGARGIYYFMLPGHQDIWEVLRELAMEMQTLGPVALTPDVPQTVRYHPDPDQYDLKGVFPDVQVALHAHPAGGYVLLAANSQWYPVDAEFKLSLLGETETIRRLFGDETYAVTAGGFSERLEPFATRAYTIAGINAGDDVVQIDVAMTPLPELARAEAPTVSRFDGRNQNLIANPSFEIATLPNFPDYYKPYTSGQGQGFFPLEMINTPQAPLSLDTNTAWHGRQALKMSVKGGQNAGVYIEQGQSHVTDRYTGNPHTVHVFSVYLKGDRDGIKVRFGANRVGARETEVAVTREWKRYHWTLTLPARIWLLVNQDAAEDGGGTVWMDALQLEPGTTPTEFADFEE